MLFEISRYFYRATSGLPAVLQSFDRSPVDMLLILMVTVGVLVLAWLSARFLAKKSTQTRREGLMQMADRLMLGKDKQIILLKVGEQYYLVGMSQNSIQFSQPIKPESFADMLAKKQNSGDFFSAFRSAVGQESRDGGSDQDQKNQQIRHDHRQDHVGSRFQTQFEQAVNNQRTQNMNKCSGGANHQKRQGCFALQKIIDLFNWRSRWQMMKLSQQQLSDQNQTMDQSSFTGQSQPVDHDQQIDLNQTVIQEKSVEAMASADVSQINRQYREENQEI